MTEILTPEASADGKRNAYHHQCSVVGTQQAFASCVNKIDRRKHGALPAIYSECSAAIGKKVCPAIGMRKEELVEKKAIYFKERVRFMGLSALVDKAKELLRPLVQAPTPAPKVNTTAISADYMAQALTSAVKKASTPPTSGVQNRIVVRQGETLLEAARRMQNSQQ